MFLDEAICVVQINQILESLKFHAYHQIKAVNLPGTTLRLTMQCIVWMKHCLLSSFPRGKQTNILSEPDADRKRDRTFSDQSQYLVYQCLRNKKSLVISLIHFKLSRKRTQPFGDTIKKDKMKKKIK